MKPFKTEIDEKNYLEFVQDRADPRSKTILKRVMQDTKVQTGRAQQIKLEEQSSKLKTVKVILENELEKEKIKNQKMQNLKTRVKRIEKLNLKRRRDLSSFIHNFQNGKADGFVRMLERVWRVKGKSIRNYHCL